MHFLFQARGNISVFIAIRLVSSCFKAIIKRNSQVTDCPPPSSLLQMGKNNPGKTVPRRKISSSGFFCDTINWKDDIITNLEKVATLSK